MEPYPKEREELEMIQLITLTWAYLKQSLIVLLLEMLVIQMKLMKKICMASGKRYANWQMELDILQLI